MKTGNKAFSLTEMLIVLVVIALLFAAMAPIVTKRHVVDTHEAEAIWNFVSNDSERNAYFDPGSETWTSSVYVGYIPTSADNSAGKLSINTGDITYNSTTYKQPQMQFRFSPDTDQQGRGINTGTLLLTSNNVYFGSNMSTSSGERNTVAGLSNLVNGNTSNNSTILGNYAMEKALVANNTQNNYITAIGHRAASQWGTASSGAKKGIYIGAGAGSGLDEIDSAATGNIALGYLSNSYIGYESSSWTGSRGSYNVFAGVNSGSGFTNTNASYNTIINSSFTATSAANNTIIGYGTYNKGDSAVHNMTAIGYEACDSISGNNSGRRVCIGYNSAISSNNTPESFNTDSAEHIYLGGRPQSGTSKGFAGRSMLEIHNDGSNANVVINSNLVVRGNFYPSDGTNIVFNRFSDTQTVGAEGAYYRCDSDSYRNILVFNNYICTTLKAAEPKSKNLLYKGGNCGTSDGYPNGSGCPNIASDIRLKTDIAENNDGIEKILLLEPYNYVYKNDKTKTPQVGVIAQDLQKIFPNSVTKNKDGFLKIRWDEMFYAMINAIKDFASKVEKIALDISNIENNIKNIHNKQKNIQKQISVLNHRLDRLERK